MPRIVIVGYRPKPGKADALRDLTRRHVEVLRAEGLATDRPSVVMEARDGTIVEVFEWSSQEAIERAHSNPQVLAMWSEYSAACDYVPLNTLPELSQMFADFTPV